MLCPSAWFVERMEDAAIREVSGCDSLQQLFLMPLAMKRQWLAYKQVMDKARPFLDKIAQQKLKEEKQND